MERPERAKRAPSSQNMTREIYAGLHPIPLPASGLTLTTAKKFWCLKSLPLRYQFPICSIILTSTRSCSRHDIQTEPPVMRRFTSPAIYRFGACTKRCRRTSRTAGPLSAVVSTILLNLRTLEALLSAKERQNCHSFPHLTVRLQMPPQIQMNWTMMRILILICLIFPWNSLFHFSIWIWKIHRFNN